MDIELDCMHAGGQRSLDGGERVFGSARRVSAMSKVAVDPRTPGRNVARLGIGGDTVVRRIGSGPEEGLWD
jgi:hypothetical protein